MDKAVNEFNKIKVKKEGKCKRVGVVGEIYLKSNCFSNSFLVDFLEDRGYEVALPTFITFLEYDFFSSQYNTKNKIENEFKDVLKKGVIRYVMNYYRQIAEEHLKKYKRYRPDPYIKEALEKGINPLPLYLQFGEGWLLGMEMAEMIEQGIKDIVVVQPFGCISNNIVAKGIYRLLRDKFDVNILSLDFDASTSQANILNRIELFLRTKEE